VTIGFQGESGAFSEEAALGLFGDVRTRGFFDLDTLIAAVETQEVQYGLLPCENSVYGTIARAYDLLYKYRTVCIVDETSHVVVQCLIGTLRATLDKIRTVSSHQVAIEQCRAFLSRQTAWSIGATYDTAGSVKEVVRRGDATFAAIAPASSARRYGGRVLVYGIQDRVDNTTRFFVLSKDPTPRRNRGRFCLVFALPDEPGCLQATLAALVKEDFNLRNLVLRPSDGRPFDYLFYVEIDSDRHVRPDELLRAMPDSTRILGSY
jgi:prephenate dehydratase